MLKLKIAVFLIVSILFNSCVSLKKPILSKRSNTEIKEGYLSLKTINQNLNKQMPLIEKVGNDEVEIVSVATFASKDNKSFVIEMKFIFRSFEIPEGLPAIARTIATLDYNPKTKEFKFAKIAEPEIRFLKANLTEYLKPQQRKFMYKTLVNKLYTLVLHKSKKELNTVKGFTIKEGKIKIEFN